MTTLVVEKEGGQITAEDGIEGIKCTLTYSHCFGATKGHPITIEFRVVGIESLPVTDFVMECQSNRDLNVIQVPGTSITIVSTNVSGVWKVKPPKRWRNARNEKVRDGWCQKPDEWHWNESRGAGGNAKQGSGQRELFVQ